jgi:hypothetical protein
MLNMVTNKISTAKPGRFEDFIEKCLGTNQVKTASTKVAEEQKEAPSSGQLDVEPLHQEGESTTMPKSGPSVKKEEGEKEASVDTNPEEEGKDSGQPKAEGSEKFTNDPETPCEEEKEAAVETKFVKWANLDSKNRDFLVAYWRQIFGDDFVKAMVADK